MLVTLGAADCISVVIRQSLVQLETPDDMRGRVSAVNSVFIGASNQLGEFESERQRRSLAPFRLLWLAEWERWLLWRCGCGCFQRSPLAIN